MLNHLEGFSTITNLLVTNRVCVFVCTCVCVCVCVSACVCEREREVPKEQELLANIKIDKLTRYIGV